MNIDLIIPKYPDHVKFECNYAIVDGEIESNDVVAVFKDYELAERFINDINGRTHRRFFVRQMNRGIWA